MVNEALSDSPTDNLDYSMKQELDQVRLEMRGQGCIWSKAAW